MVFGVVLTHEKVRDDLSLWLSSRKKSGHSQHILEYKSFSVCIRVRPLLLVLNYEEPLNAKLFAFHSAQVAIGLI